MIKKITQTMCLILCVSFSQVATAEQITGAYTVAAIFAEGGDKAGFYTQEGLSGCLFEIMYIDLSTEAGKAHYSAVITAKAMQWKISRVDYTVDASGKCTVTGLHVS